MNKLLAATALCATGLLAGSALAGAPGQTLTEAEAYDLGKQAYVYGYPLVLMDVTKDVSTNVEHPSAFAAPINQFAHVNSFPDASFRTVVRPNLDTLYSVAWLDLSEEPMVLSLPEMGDRYYLMPMLDQYTNVFASPGTRTTGNGAHEIAITGPDFTGSVPEGLEVVAAPTNVVWIIGRTLVEGADDLPNVVAIQQQYHLTPLCVWVAQQQQQQQQQQSSEGYQPPAGTVDPGIDMQTDPATQVSDMEAGKFFSRLSSLLAANPPTDSDTAEIRAALERLGLTDGTFDPSALSDDANRGLDRAVTDAQSEISAHSFGRVVNGWEIAIDGMGRFGTDYLLRATVALKGLGANLPEDAIYPMTHVDADGQPLTGASRYVLHFGADEIPPVQAFWSVTVYDQDGYLAANAIDRYALNSFSDLRHNEDGSLDLLIQTESPGAEKETNWLPVPAGDFNLVLRLYWPDEKVVDGTWTPPAVQLVTDEPGQGEPTEATIWNRSLGPQKGSLPHALHE